VGKLPADAPERRYFESDRQLYSSFPDDQFNCWGLPSNAEPRFRDTSVGDLVLFIPHIGSHNGGIHQIGIVASKCPVRAHSASRTLWPRTPNDRLFPWIFFFHAELGYRGWFEFLDDIGYQENWDPRGWYRRIAPSRLQRWGGAR